MHGRYPTCQYLVVSGQHFLIDCGEGSQIQLSKYHIKRNKISHIFISHLHGDHVYGLPGLLGSFNHFNRSNPLTVFGPPGLKEFIDVAIKISHAKFSYELNIHEIQPNSKRELFNDNEVSVQCFPLKHRVVNFGYSFTFSPRIKNIRKEAIEQYQLSIPMIKAAKEGKDIVLPTGDLIRNDLLTLPLPKELVYAFCSDTVYDPELIAHVKNTDLMYHETTYLDGLEDVAKERMHCTIGQAINIAEQAKVKRFLTGHYSSRYDDLQPFKEAAANANIDVIIGEEGGKYSVL